MIRICLMAALALLVCSCGRYGEFALPAAGGPKLGLEWQVVAGPQLLRGSAPDVLNPSVVRWREGYLNLYSRFDGKLWTTLAASSADGMKWGEGMVVLQPQLPWEGDYIAANGAVVEFGGELLYVYQAGGKGSNVLGLARSKDGKAWQKHPEPVLGLGPWMSWDESSIGDPYLVVAEGKLYLYYLGEDRARRQRLGVATSTDGVHWTRLRGNPLLELGAANEFDENGLGEPAVFAANGQWVMLYTGRDRKEQRALGYATSMDGVHWKKLAEPVLRGTEDWNRAVLCDATVLVEGTKARVWFGGGDLPKPDERLNGQIGYAELVAQQP